MGGVGVPQRHHLASGSFWDSERLFGEDGDPANLEHQAASGAILPYMASAVPNVDVGLSSRPIKNHWNFFSAGTQSTIYNILESVSGNYKKELFSDPPLRRNGV